MVSIHVTEPAHAYRFYTDVLGFETTLALPDADVFVVNAPGQDTGLLLEPSDNPLGEEYRSSLRAAGVPVLVMSTDTLYSDIERLRAEGVHFVGDVHQPMHAGSRPDSGGNRFQISLRTPIQPEEYAAKDYVDGVMGTNLHSIWDYYILASTGRSFSAALRQLIPVSEMRQPSNSNLSMGTMVPDPAERP